MAIYRDPNFTGAAAVALETGGILVSRRPGLDVFAPYYVAEPSTGHVGLYEIGKGLISEIQISSA
jgi:hypothetical protein